MKQVSLRTILKLARDMAGIYLDIEIDCNSSKDRTLHRHPSIERHWLQTKSTLRELQRQERRGEIHLVKEFLRASENAIARMQKRNARDTARVRKSASSAKSAVKPSGHDFFNPSL